MKKINESKNSKKANATINKVFEEMNYAEKYLKKLNLSWTESYSEVYSMDLYYLSKEDFRKIQTLQSRYHNQYNLSNFNLDIRSGQPLKKVTLYDEENNIYNCEFAKVDWNEITSTKTRRNFLFKNNGDIQYTYIKNKKTKLEYTTTYNVNSNDLNLLFNIDNEKLQASIYDNIQSIKYNNFNIEINLVNGSKKISYQSDKNINPEVTTEIILYKDGNIKSKYIEIKNYDPNSNGKNTYTFNYNKNELIEVYQINEEGKYFDMKTNSELIDLTNNILSSLSINNPIINLDKEEINKLIETIKNRLFSTIKLIKEDIPLIGLSKRLDIALSKVNSKKEPFEKQQINKENKYKTKSRKNEFQKKRR